jgi:putative flippase GtrA
MFNGKFTDRTTVTRIMRFVVVGGLAAVVQFLVLAALKSHLTAWLAFSGSFVCSTATHYALNRFWALPSSRRDTGRQFGEYLLTVAVSYGINVGAFQLCHYGLGLTVMWAAVFAIPPSTIVVFLLLNYRVFRAKID